MKLNNKIWIAVGTIIALIGVFTGKADWGSLIFFLLVIIGIEICNLSETLKEGIISHVIKYNIDATEKKEPSNEETDIRKD